MFKFFVFAHLLIVCAGATPVPAARPTQPPAFLPPPAQETMNFSVEGKLTKHTGTQLTINTEGNIIFRIVYNETTRIVRKNDSEGTPKDLVPGVLIRVNGDLTESGEIIAQKITIQSESAPKKH